MTPVCLHALPATSRHAHELVDAVVGQGLILVLSDPVRSRSPSPEF